ncbi:MAG: hypothetical protein COU33_01210, partial [Candidatus Magasanikbacteria bacterium CG10_big_fil_rev_8_21_14_0_10_43_6]
QFSQDILSEVLAQDVLKDKNSLVVIDGIRRPGDMAHLKEIPGFILVHIFADLDTRYTRLTHRGENTDDNKKTKEAFIADHKREAELKIVDIAAEATEYIDNNGTLEALHAQLDALVQKYESSD